MGLLSGRPGLPRRPMLVPRTSNPLHPAATATGPSSGRVDTISPTYQDPVEQMLSSSRGILQLPDVPPRPGTLDIDLARRKAAADAFAGPAWHYLDVLKHAGGIMSSVQYVASERDLKEFWEMYAMTEAG